MPPCQGCFQPFVKLTARQVIGREDAVTGNILHPDNELLPGADDMCEGVEAFISPVGDINDVIQPGAFNHAVKGGPLMKLFLSLEKDIHISVVQQVIIGIECGWRYYLFHPHV